MLPQPSRHRMTAYFDWAAILGNPCILHTGTLDCIRIAIAAFDTGTGRYKHHKHRRPCIRSSDCEFRKFPDVFSLTNTLQTILDVAT